MRLTSVLTIFLMVILIISARAQSDKIEMAASYESNGETEKALDIYGKLSEKSSNIPKIHEQYFNLLINNQEWEVAQDYIRDVLKNYPDNIQYKIDQGYLHLQQDHSKRANRIFENVLKEVIDNSFKIKLAANYFIRKGLTERAINTYKTGRKNLGDSGKFSLELASIYQQLDQEDNMIQEYLNHAENNPEQVESVKNNLQEGLEDQGFSSLEQALFKKIRNNPDVSVYNDLLVWVKLQKKAFDEAFVQAKALDNKTNGKGKNVMKVASIATENGFYNKAIEYYDYVVSNYKNGPYFSKARRSRIETREKLIKNSYPVDTSEIRKLVNDYDDFIQWGKEVNGFTNEVAEAYHSQAKLYAFYLNEEKKANTILEALIKNGNVSSKLKAKSKLDMGDIYILLNKPWESILLYAQVEKSQDDSPIGYEAKLRSAKLSYYKGDFELAQDHLDVLKLATTREIANDAMDLSLLIQNNTALDSTTHPLEKYASVELLLFQNQRQKALSTLDSMLNEYQDHSLLDEIHWLKARIFKEMGSFNQAISELDLILENYPKDILGDNAMYLKGKIYENHLDNIDKAKDVYAAFLRRYKGSIYYSEVRKKYRNLRGDMVPN